MVIAYHQHWRSSKCDAEATHSSKGIMSADQAFYLRETTIIGGVAGGFSNRYKLIGILNYDAYAPFRVNISMGSYASTDRYLIDATLTYIIAPCMFQEFVIIGLAM